MIRSFFYVLTVFSLLFAFTMCKKTNPIDDDILLEDTLNIDTTRIDSLINDSLEVDTNIVDTLITDTIISPTYIDGLCINIMPDTNCVEIPPPGDFGYFYEYMELDYSAASFNPCNNDELVCIRHRNGLSDGLVILNIKTQNEKVLLEGEVRCHPNWGEKGWIVFCRQDNQIWKIRDNGEDLTQLTFKAEGWNVLPSWIDNGERIVFESTRDLHNGRLFTMDEKGENIEMVPNSIACSFTAMSKDSKYLIYRRNLVSVFSLEIRNLETGEIKIIEGIERSNLSGAVWHPIHHDIVVWSNFQTMYAMNVSTNKMVQLKTGCSSEIYRHFDFKADGSGFIYQLDLSSSLPNTFHLLFNHQIIEMDLCGLSTILIE